MTQPFTYYDAHGDAEVLVNRVPQAGNGRVWVRGRYSNDVRPSPLEARVGRGIKVWELIRDLRSLNDSVDALVELHTPAVDRNDIEAAVGYFQKYDEEIERKLSEELALA